MMIENFLSPAETGMEGLYSVRLISDTDGNRWELMLNFRERYGCLFPVLVTDPEDKLISLPGRQYHFKLPA